MVNKVATQTPTVVAVMVKRTWITNTIMVGDACICFGFAKLLIKIQAKM